MIYEPTPEDIKAEYDFNKLLSVIKLTREQSPVTIEMLRKSIVGIAKCFRGVHEIGKTNTGYWIDRFLRAGHGCSGDAWCCGFVQFAYEQASTALGLPDLMPCDTVGTQELARWIKHQNVFILSINEIKPGDVVVWTNGRGSLKGHTGIVANIDAKYIYTIEGNTSTGNKFDRDGGYVAEKKYLKSEFKIGAVSDKRYVNCVGSAELMYRRATNG